MTKQLPTRTQLIDAMEFFASYAGSAFEDEGTVELETGLTIQALRRHVEVTQHGRGAVIALPEPIIQGYMERWLRANWEEMVDYMVDSDLAIDDTIEDKPCPKVTAHGGHYWDASQFPDHFGPAGGDLIEFHCDGIKVHPTCMIAGGGQRGAR